MGTCSDTSQPTDEPTAAPTDDPSNDPTTNPIEYSVNNPSEQLSISSSKNPTIANMVEQEAIDTTVGSQNIPIEVDEKPSSKESGNVLGMSAMQNILLLLTTGVAVCTLTIVCCISINTYMLKKKRRKETESRGELPKNSTNMLHSVPSESSNVVKTNNNAYEGFQKLTKHNIELPHIPQLGSFNETIGQEYDDKSESHKELIPDHMPQRTDGFIIHDDELYTGLWNDKNEGNDQQRKQDNQMIGMPQQPQIETNKDTLGQKDDDESASDKDSTCNDIYVNTSNGFDI